MVMTPSTMVDLGTKAGDFSLPDTAGRTVQRSDFQGKPLLVLFICNHCPFVKHIRTHLAATSSEYQKKGVGIVGISSNDVTSHPDDGPEKMALEVKAAGYTFPYLYDETQEVARAYHAACTPDFFLFDKAHKLVYRGRYDESRPESGIPVTGVDLKRAMDAVLAGKPVPADQKGSMGCNIKWKKGKEPEYFRQG
jgi:peroxiredoxin